VLCTGPKLWQRSKRRAQRVRYPAAATIVDRVTGVSMDLVEPCEKEGRVRGWPNCKDLPNLRTCSNYVLLLLKHFSRGDSRLA
jgi:hypothetical protein